MNQYSVTSFIFLISLIITPLLINAREQPPPLPDQSTDSPPPLPIESHMQYYYEKKHQKIGPFQLRQIRELIKKGVIKRHTLVWSSGKTNWSRAELFPELMNTFAQEAPAPDLPDDLSYKNYLVGVWKVTSGNEKQRKFGDNNTTIYKFNSDGSFSSVTKIYTALSNDPIIMEPVTGKWYVTPIKDGLFTLTISRIGVESWYRRESFNLRIKDENILINEDTGDQAIRLINDE